MKYKKTVFLGGTVVMAAAVVIFAQEPARRVSQSRRADVPADQWKYHEIALAAARQAATAKPAATAQADSLRTSDGPDFLKIESARVNPAHVEESSRGSAAEPTLTKLDPFADLADTAVDDSPTSSSPVRPASYEFKADTQVADGGEASSLSSELEPADDLLELIPAADHPTLADSASTADSPQIAETRHDSSAGTQGDFASYADHLSELATGPQSPALTVSWDVPDSVNVGDETLCNLVVVNQGQSVASETAVQVAFLGNVQVVRADPVPEQGGDHLLWSVGTLQPGEERHIQIGLVAEETTDVVPVAKVTSATIAYGRISVRQPKLDLAIAAKEDAVIGDVVAYSLEVSNPGTGPAHGVVVESTLPEGLKHAKGSVLSYSIGTLAPGESRSVQIVASAATAGVHRIEGRAKTTSAHAAATGLTADAETEVRIVAPALNVAVEGPKLRYLDRSAVYNIEVTNPGTMPANNVRLAEVVPAGFEYVEATGGASYNAVGRSVEWFLGQLEPGTTTAVQVKLLATELGEQVHRVTAEAERGVQAEAQTITQVEGIAALLLKVVDVDDPIEVGSETMYEIRIDNQGTKAAADVQVVVEIPEGMEPLAATGPTTFQTKDRQIVFAPIPRVGPRADAVYRVTVRGAKPGDLRFRAWLKGGELSTPVLKEESTRVYGD